MEKPKILLVDDTRLVLELEKSFLKSSAVEVATAENGAAALELIRKTPPDLIFMDVNMPAMDGLTCCRTIKKDPFLCGIPIVMVTTAGSEEDRARAREAGCDNYLTKPLDRHLFLDMARKYVGSVERRAPRLPCHIPVLVMQGELLVAAQALDLAEGGLFLATATIPSPDLPIKIGFFLPSTGTLVEASGRIAWVNAPASRVKGSLPAGFGVQFAGVEEGALSSLKLFLQRQMAAPTVL